MPLTANDVRDRAASELGILRLGQSLQSQDDAQITQYYAEVYADLSADGLANFLQTSVPDELAGPVIFMVAHKGIGTYGVSQARMDRILAHTGIDDEIAKRKIRNLIEPYEGSVGGVSDY